MNGRPNYRFRALVWFIAVLFSFSPAWLLAKIDGDPIDYHFQCSNGDIDSQINNHQWIINYKNQPDPHGCYYLSFGMGNGCGCAGTCIYYCYGVWNSSQQKCVYGCTTLGISCCNPQTTECEEPLVMNDQNQCYDPTIPTCGIDEQYDPNYGGCIFTQCHKEHGWLNAGDSALGNNGCYKGCNYVCDRWSNGQVQCRQDGASCFSPAAPYPEPDPAWPAPCDPNTDPNCAQNADDKSCQCYGPNGTAPCLCGSEIENCEIQDGVMVCRQQHQQSGPNAWDLPEPPYPPVGWPNLPAGFDWPGFPEPPYGWGGWYGNTGQWSLTLWTLSQINNYYQSHDIPAPYPDPENPPPNDSGGGHLHKPGLDLPAVTELTLSDVADNFLSGLSATDIGSALNLSFTWPSCGCPSLVIPANPIIGAHTIDFHCQILSEYQGVISSFMRAGWFLMGIFIMFAF